MSTTLVHLARACPRRTRSTRRGGVGSTPTCDRSDTLGEGVLYTCIPLHHRRAPLPVRLRRGGGHAHQTQRVELHLRRRHCLASSLDRQLELSLQVPLLDHTESRAVGPLLDTHQDPRRTPRRGCARLPTLSKKGRGPVTDPTNRLPVPAMRNAAHRVLIAAIVAPAHLAAPAPRLA